MNYPKNQQLRLISNIDWQGSSKQSIEWYLDNILISTSDMTTIEPGLPLGLHDIKFVASNTCGKSCTKTEQINIVESDKMEKTVTVVVNQPIVQAAIVMDFTGTVEATVTDGVNPVAGASMELDATATGIVTGIDGKASIPNVPYGTHTVKAVKV